MERILLLILMSWLGLCGTKKVISAIGALLVSSIHIEIVIGEEPGTRENTFVIP